MFKTLSNATAFLSRTGSSVASNHSSVLEFEAVDIHGENQLLSKYAGDVTLIVNVATQWGLTALNYKQLQELNTKYGEQGLKILAFPCNQFGGQEPGTDEEIVEFVAKYGVTFDMFHKIEVNGAGAIPLFKWLKEKLHGTITNAIKWNFTKFLCDRDGTPFKRYASNVAPNDLIPDIEALLSKHASEKHES